jgi:spore germination cell wall hydrolase CwlJ-like protein
VGRAAVTRWLSAAALAAAIIAWSLALTRCAFGDELDCLADNVYYEAAHEPAEGKLAVAQVTLNRAHGGDICAAVYAKALNPRTGKKEAAFSWTLGRRWKPRGMDLTAYWESLLIAQSALAGARLASIGDAEYYHAVYIHPRWHLKKVARIGHHVFYRR